MAELEGLKVQLIVSDPWEFGTTHGTGPFSATILKEHKDLDNSTNGAILLQLEKPLEFKSTKCEFFVASPRLAHDHISDIAKGIEIGCALTLISEDRANSADWSDLSWWRGGIGLLALIKRCEAT